MVRLLYQINEKARNVSFVIANSNADIINSIENGKTLTLSFEEIKKNIEDIRLYFDRYDYSVSRIAKRLDRSKKPLIKEVDKLKKGTSNNSNILVHYYTHILSNQALTERKRIDDSVYDLISFNSIANNSKSKMIELMNNIKRTFFLHWRANYENSSYYMQCNKKTVYLQDSYRSSIYNVADKTLFNFFCDFKHAIRVKDSIHGNIFNFADTTYFESNNGYDSCHNETTCNNYPNYCKQVGCQTFFLLPKKRKKRAPNNPSEHPIEAIKGKFRGKDYELRRMFPDNPKASLEFNESKEGFYQEIEDKVLELESNNRGTDCPEMRAFYQKLGKKIHYKFSEIRSKYEKDNNEKT